MKPPSITKKQSEILFYLSTFRFLDRTQLQRLHNHKSPTRIKDWLTDLTQKDYLGRIYNSSYGENTKPAIYYLKLNAIQYLREAGPITKEYSRKLYREDERSSEFIAHSMRIADICLNLQERNHHGHNDDFLLYVALTAPELDASELSFLSELHPDLVIVKKDKRGTEKHHLLMLLEPTLPVASIRMKLKQIIKFYYAATWEEHISAPFPIVLLVCPTKPYLIVTKRLVERVLEASQNPEDIHFRLALAENVAKHGITGEIWE
jgi:hypothetical protein